MLITSVSVFDFVWNVTKRWWPCLPCPCVKCKSLCCAELGPGRQILLPESAAHPRPKRDPLPVAADSPGRPVLGVGVFVIILILRLYVGAVVARLLRAPTYINSPTSIVRHVTRNHRNSLHLIACHFLDSDDKRLVSVLLPCLPACDRDARAHRGDISLCFRNNSMYNCSSAFTPFGTAEHI